MRCSCDGGNSEVYEKMEEETEAVGGFKTNRCLDANILPAKLTSLPKLMLLFSILLFL